MALAASSFTPKAISGCVFWMDASNAASITSSAGAVSQINDLCGANNAVQATAANQPTTGGTQNGLGVLTFNGTSAYLASPLAIPGAAVTAFLIMENTRAAVFDTDPLSIGNATNFSDIPDHNIAAITGNVPSGSSGLDVFRGATTNTGTNGTVCVTNGAVANANSPAIYETRISASGNITGLGSEGQENSSTGCTSAALATTYLWIGADGITPEDFLQGWVGEVVVFNRELAPAEISEMDGYLACKWGTQGILVNGQPYQTLCPVGNVGNDTFPPANTGNGRGIAGNRGNG